MNALLSILLAGCLMASPAPAQVTVGSVSGLREALETADGPTTITLKPGRYDFWPEEAAHEWIFVSCTSAEEETSDKTKVIGLWINRLSDITIEGEGATMVCHGQMTPIGISESKNITIKGLEVDFERPGMSEITYVSCESGRTVCHFHKDSRYSIEDGKLRLVGEGWVTEYPHCIKYNPDSDRLTFCPDWGILQGCKATEIEPGTVSFETPADFKAVPGDIITIRDRIRRQTGSLVQYSENIRLEGMKYRFMHGIGVLCQFTRNVSIADCIFAPDSASGRIMASSADFAHFSDCAGLVEVRGCKFSGAQDDPINVHGTNLQSVSKEGPRSLKVRFAHPQTYGIKEYRPGDEVAFVRAETLERFAYATVTGVERLNDHELLVTFNRRIPGSIKLGADCVENLTWMPEVIISGNEFYRTSTRGVLLTTPRKTVIENNTFHKLGMSAILIEPDAASWFSSGPVMDVTIRGNRFEDCCFNGAPDNAYIAVNSSNKVADKKHPVQRNIVIEGNTFVLRDGCPPLSAKSVKGLTFRNNIITGPDNAPAVILHGCSKVDSDIPCQEK